MTMIRLGFIQNIFYCIEIFAIGTYAIKLNIMPYGIRSLGTKCLNARNLPNTFKFKFKLIT